MQNILSVKAADIVALLKGHGLKLACAESCTGGMVSSAIVSVSGASAVLELGVTSYTSRIKESVLGVSADTLNTYGAVSRQTAREMAVGIRRLASSDIGISVTGVAGPEPCEGKAVGTVYIALTDGKTITAQRLDIGNLDRTVIRETACLAVFELIENYVKEKIA